jgi:hypothetical protein
MDWALVREQLEPGFQRAMATIKARYPNIVVRPSWANSPPLGRKFRAYVSFIYDTRQRYEDLLFDFYVQPVNKRWPRRLDDSPLCPDAPDRPDAVRPDAAVFAIERGTGAEIAELEPVLLPDDQDSPLYERAVLDYAAVAIAFVEEQMDRVLYALSVQYLDPAEDRLLIEDYRNAGCPLPPGWCGGETSALLI